jgi:murein DD-endopeptidase MepM/ murein hydrolase activator NlpD/GH24 family phage-related lysozyme (muramidase)
MYDLIYGKKTLKQKSIKESKPDVADLVEPNVAKFFENSENIEAPLFQQKRGSMSFKKDVETIQIGLILLGYPLPRFGVDGLYGPETAQAVEKFKSDNSVKDDIEEEISLNEGQTLQSPINISRVSSNFGQKRSYENHPGVDLPTPSGTPIKSPADGKVIDARFKEGACGGTIQVEHGGGFKSRYCHAKDIRVQVGQMVKQGDVLGLTGGGVNDKGRGRSTGPHLHFELKKDGQLVDPMDYINVEIGSYEFKTSSGQKIDVRSVVTDEMLELMISKLKQKNLKSKDLEPYTLTKIQSGGFSTDFAGASSVNLDDIKLSNDWVGLSTKFVAKNEGFTPNATWDVNAYRLGFGSDKVLTIDGQLRDVIKGDTTTPEDALKVLQYEMSDVYKKRLVGERKYQIPESIFNKLKDNQKAALISYVYNVGSLRVGIADAIKRGDFSSAAKQIAAGPITGGGVVYKGLIRRRKEESELFMT